MCCDTDLVEKRDGEAAGLDGEEVQAGEEAVREDEVA
jgi:hypothetical protein